jgi:hypothetical protein
MLHPHVVCEFNRLAIIASMRFRRRFLQRGLQSALRQRYTLYSKVRMFDARSR